MSKESEALKSIKGTIISTSRGDWGFEYRYVSDIESTKKHFDILEQALKRNEPMAIIYTRVSLAKTEDFWDEPTCPKCKLIVVHRDKFCYECGQALDWSDEK